VRSAEPIGCCGLSRLFWLVENRRACISASSLLARTWPKGSSCFWPRTRSVSITITSEA
jgi:hypothetical protein